MIYDGECNFCKFWIMRLREFTADRIEFIASQDPRVAHDYPELPREWFDTAVQLIEPDGSVYAGAEAGFRALAIRAPGTALTWSYANVPGFAPVSEYAYHFVAKRREFFSKLTRLLWGRNGAVPRYNRVRWVFLRSLGLIYLIAFASLGTQIKGLIGANGVVPAAEFMTAVQQHFDAAHVGLERYHRLPTLCWFGASDRFLQGLCVAGGLLAVVLVLNFAPALCLILLWLIYLSLMSVGGDFLSFQWDALLLETGFLAIFLAPPQFFAWRRAAPPSRLALWLLRWLLFQLMFESGVVKLISGDSTWKHLLALNYHYETQPLPTWIGWYAHQLPEAFQKLSVFIMFVIEIAVPFLVFAPRRPKLVGCFLLIFLQVAILLTGNYCFFNLLTIALCMLWLDDAALARFIPSRWRSRESAPAPDFNAESLPHTENGTLGEISIPPIAVETVPRPRGWPRSLVRPLAVIILLLTSTGMLARFGWMPVPSPLLALEEWLGPFQTLNHYGLFAVMTTARPEIIIEGSDDGKTWLPYEFKYKAGDVNRRPGFVAPHQPRLDWQMWFAALRPNGRDRWFVGLCVRLLEGSPDVLALLERNPFPGKPPRYLRAEYYDYQFTNFAERRATGAWWRRKRIGEYLPPVPLPGK